MHGVDEGRTCLGLGAARAQALSELAGIDATQVGERQARVDDRSGRRAKQGRSGSGPETDSDKRGLGVAGELDRRRVRAGDDQIATVPDDVGAAVGKDGVGVDVAGARATNPGADDVLRTGSGGRYSRYRSSTDA